MNISKKQFNKELAEKLINTALRSIEIIKRLERGEGDLGIMEVLKCERSLVYYYIKKLTK